MRNVLDFLWKCAVSNNPMVQQTWLNEQDAVFQDILLTEGYLVRSTYIAESIRIHGTLHEVSQTLYPSCKIKFFYYEEGRPCEVAPNDLVLYHVRFTPLQKLLHDELDCGGIIREIVPNLLWKIGTAGQQRREVYLARNWGNEPAVQNVLNGVKNGSLIFRLCCSPEKSRFDEAQVYDVSDLLVWVNNQLIFDADAVFGNLKDMVANRPQRLRKKSQPKQTEHQQKAETLLVAWFQYKYENDKRIKHGKASLRPQIKLDITDQKAFAQQLGIPQPAVSRMKRTWGKDMLGNGYIYKQLLESLGKNTPDYFLDFYNDHKDYMRKIGIEY